MKKLFLLALPMALAAVSCSDEEVVSVNNDANEIKFSVVAENGTRAQNLFCNLNKPTTFNVWAAVGGKQYFENVTYVKEANPSTTYKAEGGKVHFWPTTSTLVDFYALSEETKVKNGENPAEYNAWTTGFTWNPNAASKINWTTRSLNAPEQTDLLYAYTQQSRPEGTAGVVGINFRHALSQIVFKAKNTNKTIDVTIDKVDVVNVAKSGVFTMPFGVDNVTDDPIVNHKTEGTYQDGVGSWDIQTLSNNTASAGQTYTTTKFNAVHVTAAGDNLTEETMGADTHSNFGLSLLLIPQETTAWVPATTKKPTESTGSYFVVYCKIRNVATGDGNVNDTDDLYLWGDKNNTAAVYIPFKADWDPGKKYIYTFNFGSQTTGGYDPNGDPVLIPISFTVTVDDFVKVSDETIWMGPNE